MGLNWKNAYIFSIFGTLGQYHVIMWDINTSMFNINIHHIIDTTTKIIFYTSHTLLLLLNFSKFQGIWSSVCVVYVCVCDLELMGCVHCLLYYTFLVEFKHMIKGINFHVQAHTQAHTMHLHTAAAPYNPMLNGCEDI